MTLSLVIPTWNRADILDDCLSRLPDIDCEVIVSDNASTDHTDDVIFRYEAQEPGAYQGRGVANQSRHAFANLRHAVSHAQGDVICYLADDDSLLGEPLKDACGPDAQRAYRGAVLRSHRLGRRSASRDASVLRPEQPGHVRERSHPTAELHALNHDPARDRPVQTRRAMIKGADTHRPGACHSISGSMAMHGKRMVRFDLLAFYREHLVMKAGAEARHDHQPRLGDVLEMGDEQRLGLEGHGLSTEIERDLNLSFDKQPLSRRIDRMLHQRAVLEIKPRLSAGRLHYGLWSAGAGRCAEARSRCKAMTPG